MYQDLLISVTLVSLDVQTVMPATKLIYAHQDKVLHVLIILLLHDAYLPEVETLKALVAYQTLVFVLLNSSCVLLLHLLQVVVVCYVQMVLSQLAVIQLSILPATLIVFQLVVILSLLLVISLNFHAPLQAAHPLLQAVAIVIVEH